MGPISTSNTPAPRVSRFPRAARILYRKGIERGGEGAGLNLGGARQRRGVNPAVLLREIEGAPVPDPVERNTARRPGFVDLVPTLHHRPLVKARPRPDALAAQVRSVTTHGAERLLSVQRKLGEIEEDLHDHGSDGERHVFPVAVDDRGRSGGIRTSVLEQERLRPTELLVRPRTLSKGDRVPVGACRSWQALWTGFEAPSEYSQIHLEPEGRLHCLGARC